MTTLLSASLAALAGTLLLAEPADPADPASDADCHPIEGTITARVTDVGVSLRGLRAAAAGTSAGDLTGPVALEATRALGADDFDLVLRVHTVHGALRLAGRASTSDGDAGGARRLAGSLAVGGGTGGYARAAGSLTARGSADVADRRAVVQYRGTLCGAARQAGR